MMLVEIIMGEKTGAKALATAIDFVRAIKKTPIVVNDCRGFYANRCVGNYIREGHLMLMEGVPPAMIENAAKMAGMPVGPLSLNDEVAIDLGWKNPAGDQEGSRRQRGRPRRRKSCWRRWSSRSSAFGRKNGKGFYDYPAKGRSAVAGPWRRSPARSSIRTRFQRPGSEGPLPLSRRRWRPRAAWRRTSSPTRARPTSARSSASASRRSPAARFPMIDGWALRRSSSKQTVHNLAAESVALH
jgi:3-hydroxyacyl-CoA dehydrogenase